MLTAVVTLAGDSLVSVRLQTAPTEPPTTEATAADEEHAEDGATAVDGTTDEAHATETHEELDEGPSPIMPEAKELALGLRGLHRAVPGDALRHLPAPARAG